MNDVILKELKIVVERAVRPVRATMVRKRRMREELLAHLSAIFEEEAARLGDERAALERAAERFGDPAELTAELQQSVPRWDRFRAVLGKALDLAPGESLLRLAWRFAVITAVLSAVIWIALLPKFLFGSRRGELGMVTYVLFVVGVSSVGMTYVFSVLTMGFYRAMEERDAGRRRRLLWLYGVVSVPVFPIFAFLWYLTLTGDLASSLVHCGLACCVAPLTPLLFFGAARSMAEQMRHNEEWASLRIEQ
jgi:hypothetical protein